MAQQSINIGSVPNDGTGDTLRAAGNKINQNFTEVYAMSTIMTALGFLAGMGSGDNYTMHLKLPSCLGGYIIQGGAGRYADGAVVTFPISFPTRAVCVATPANGTSNADNVDISGFGGVEPPYSSFIVRHNLGGDDSIQWLAFGK